MSFYEGAFKLGAVVATSVALYTGSSALMGQVEGTPSPQIPPQAEATTSYSTVETDRNVALAALLCAAAFAASGAALHEKKVNIA